jgi:hypothetical protein
LAPRLKYPSLGTSRQFDAIGNSGGPPAQARHQYSIPYTRRSVP